MTETLTESFCERCGTRYTFESARPRVRLKSVKVLSRGLKNFVLSDDTSMDEAMAAARSETDRESTAHQLDAFHKTFNFCMSCRQYTCPNCWNEPEARCLTCAPLALPEEPAIAHDLRSFRDALPIGQPASANGTADQEHEPEAAWSTATDVVAEEAALAPAVEAETASEVEAAAATAPDVEAETPVEGKRVASAEPLPTPSDPARKAAAQTMGLLQRFRPGQSLDAELDAFERERAGAATAHAEPQPEPAVPAHPEPVAEATEPQPVEASTPQAAAGPADVAAPEPEPEPAPLAAASAADVVEQPTWRIKAPDAIDTTAPTPPVVGDAGVPLQASASPAAPVAEPQWPTRPQWPSTTPTAGLPFLGRPAAPQGGIEALWAASNQEVATAAPPVQGRKGSGVQPCISCGLSLSANARFCRRCGTLQGH